MQSAARAIAFYLPQFHAIPENDEFWGKGFTEWTNSAKAKPLFRGHYQPHIPSELGYYDLTNPDVRAAQAQLARDHGVEAFCYYHYWFAGRRVLERPINEVLSSGKPDFPFCLAWANQSWTGIWHGAPHRMLIEQTYPGMDDHRRHFEALLPAFSDPRYLRVDGKPLFIVYRPEELPDSVRVTDLWRELAVRAGLSGLYLIGEHANPKWDPNGAGFDASAVVRLPRRDKRIPWSRPIDRIAFTLSSWAGKPTVYRYDDVLNNVTTSPLANVESFPCVIPNWDNTPRTGANGLVLRDSTPEGFRRQIRRALSLLNGAAPDRRIVFVKSWNEWGEGNHLEPDQKFGRQYLEALRDELMAAPAGE
jgi:lipopolysaccharide biosynthesis protein